MLKLFAQKKKRIVEITDDALVRGKAVHPGDVIEVPEDDANSIIRAGRGELTRKSPTRDLDAKEPEAAPKKEVKPKKP